MYMYLHMISFSLMYACDLSVMRGTCICYYISLFINMYGSPNWDAPILWWIKIFYFRECTIYIFESDVKAKAKK